MISDELRRALEKLNRGPLEAATPGCPDPALEPPPREALSIDDIAPCRVIQSDKGACLLFERALAQLFDEPHHVTEPFTNVFIRGRHALDHLEPDSDWQRLLSTPPHGITFLDIETLGLAGTPVFLVGLLNYVDDNLLIRQFFARDYSEELHMLAAVTDALVGCDCLVTFNGKTFDVPVLTDRMRAHLLQPPAIDFHFDLLHESRRRFKHVLPNCKLQTLEYHICRRRRTGDVPGALIPKVYHDFVAGADASGIRDILHHNALDLVAMVQILTFIAEGGELVWED